jgi:hypothetical protein
MQNINTFLKENIKAVSPNNVFVSPSIPDTKLNNAVKSYNLTNGINAIIAIYDNTVFGSAKDGIIFTGEKIIYKEIFEDPIELVFSDFESVKYVEDISVNDKGKESKKEYVDIGLKSGATTRLKNLQSCNYKKLAGLLEQAFSDFEEFEEENQLVTLADMSESLKVAYVKVIINMAFADDGEVDKKEFAEILLLMTRLDLTTESRFSLRSYINSEPPQDTLSSLINDIDNACVPSHNKAVKISLVKDLISTYMSVNDGSDENFHFLDDNRDLFGVTDEEIDIAKQAIKLDFNMLREDFTDDALTKGIKELGAKAGAVGVPIAAVYLSGSVVGMSAAGMTSGLATLGLGGALGFSSMATGIGVAVLLGVGAYKGIRHFTGANELDKTKRRELMLNEVIKQTQSTLSVLIEDLNYISIKFNEALDTQDLQDAKIIKLQQMMTLLTGAAGELNIKANKLKNSSIKLHCPIVLDEVKLKSLTQEPTKQALYPLVMSFYEEESINQTRDGKSIEVTRFKIKSTIPTKDLDKLASIFEAIGYFKATEVLKGKLSGLFS